MLNSRTFADDYDHIPDRNMDWRESYYFNFVSQDNKSSGFATIGILPNQKKAEFVLTFIFEDKRINYYQVHDQAHSSLSDNTLTFRLVEPMQRWKIDFSNESLDLHIQWRARFPPFDFGKGSETSWRGHFEQSGTVKGEAKLPSVGKIAVKGYSQRDKSWGPRDWHVQEWFALHAQFKTYAIGLRRDKVNGVPYASGGLFSRKKHIAVSHVEAKMRYEKGDCKNPIGALTYVKLADGKTLTLRSRLVSPQSFVKFSRDFPKGSTELFEGMVTHECSRTGEKGTGLIEKLATHLKP